MPVCLRLKDGCLVGYYSVPNESLAINYQDEISNIQCKLLFAFVSTEKKTSEFDVRIPTDYWFLKSKKSAFHYAKTCAYCSHPSNE